MVQSILLKIILLNNNCGFYSKVDLFFSGLFKFWRIDTFFWVEYFSYAVTLFLLKPIFLHLKLYFFISLEVFYVLDNFYSCSRTFYKEIFNSLAPSGNDYTWKYLNIPAPWCIPNLANSTRLIQKNMNIQILGKRVSSSW